METKNEKKLSDEIQRFLDLIVQTRRDADYFRDEVLRAEQLSMDYLHQLELEETSYHDRARIASGLMMARKERRFAKNQLEISAPLCEFSESEQGKQLLNQIKEVLGATRKAEKLTENRSYMPRVLPAEDYYKRLTIISQAPITG